MKCANYLNKDYIMVVIVVCSDWENDRNELIIIMMTRSKYLKN